MTVRRVLGKLRPMRRAAPHQSLPPALLELARRGPEPLSDLAPVADRPLNIATVIPSFGPASGGHATIVNLMTELERAGHAVSLWLDDTEGWHGDVPAAETQARFSKLFGGSGLEPHVGFADWTEADLVMATGWQTVPRVLRLENAGSRAYLVQDHEPDFYSASAESVMAEMTYRQGLHCIAASPWLVELLQTRYGASATPFDLGVDHAIYQPQDQPRRDNLVLFYARPGTPRRAVPLGLMALQELARRRPGIEIVLFGHDRPMDVPFPHRHLGVLAPDELATLYSSATVGLAFSLTNPSLVCLEMMACGLACVELATDATRATFGSDGPLQLSDPDPLAICLATERLLDDRAARERASEEGLSFMEPRTWSHAGSQVEAGLRAAIAARAERTGA